MLYKKAFGANFNLGFNLSDFPQLHDKSYHNDVCPSFWYMKNGLYFVLWVDFENPDNRESDSKRYTITTAENLGDDGYPDIVIDDQNATIISTDEPKDIITFLLNSIS
ncbi:hypothetical protein [Alishewanella aestuarii]|uniref:hypothetical protein n=1 Tax=Alishewanella aestuarii TaxID=453835 RepID=UPI000587154B|nr:hypothetical protein [Alishewanella aestuarii]